MIKSINNVLLRHFRLGLSSSLLACDAALIMLFGIDLIVFDRKGFHAFIPSLIYASFDFSHVLADSCTAAAAFLVLPLILATIVILFTREWIPQWHLRAKTVAILHYALGNL